MNTILYNESPQLTESLQKIDTLRKNILLTVLTPRQELIFKSDATVERVFWGLAFSESTLSKNEIAKLFKEHYSEKKLSPIQLNAVTYKRGLDYISQEWLGLQEPVFSKTVYLLNRIAGTGKLRISQESLRLTLLYFQNSSEHPVIQAGLIHIQILALAPFSSDNEKMARLLSYLFLYKEGYDCRGLLVLDEYFKRNFSDHQFILKQAAQTGRQTLWLEYFARGVVLQLQKALEDVTAGKANLKAPEAMFRLNERQKQVLAYLENPDTTITNRQMQKMFKVSQITASRDLAGLAELELLFTHGKGRSVFYTKV